MLGRSSLVRVARAVRAWSTSRAGTSTRHGRETHIRSHSAVDAMECPINTRPECRQPMLHVNDDERSSSKKPSAFPASLRHLVPSTMQPSASLGTCSARNKSCHTSPTIDAKVSEPPQDQPSVRSFRDELSRQTDVVTMIELVRPTLSLCAHREQLLAKVRSSWSSPS